MKGYDKNKYCNLSSLYGWAISQKLPANNFEWIEDTSQFTEDFIKKYDEESHKGYFLEVDFQYLEKLYDLHNDLLFLPERIKIEKVEKLLIYMTKFYTHILYT